MQEVQAAMTVAKRFPRDETAAIVRIEQACKRMGLAEAAFYDYVKGGNKIVAPSIRLAEVLAQCWGNLDFGVLELDQRNGESDWMSFCWDLETNTRSSKVFTLKHEIHRKDGTVRKLDDPRDIYELGANYAARRLRACVMAVIPGDVQELAVKQCQKTLTGGSSEPLVDRIRKMVVAFSEIGVSQAMLEGRLGHNITACIEQDLLKLRGIYQSIRDGMSTREEWFELRAAPKGGKGVEGLMERLKPQEPPTLAEKAADDSQVNPAVEAGEGLDEAQEPQDGPEDEGDKEPSDAALSEGQFGAYARRLEAWPSLNTLEIIEAEIANDPVLNTKHHGMLQELLQQTAGRLKAKATAKRGTKSQV